MPPAAKSIRRRKSCLQSIRSALNVAAFVGVAPFSLRGNSLAFGTWQLPLNALCTFTFPLLGCCALVFPNPKLYRSSFSVIVFVMQYVAYSITIIASLLCNVANRGNMKSATSQLLKVERILFLLNAESKITYSYVHGIALPIFLVCCSIANLAIDWESNLPTIAMYLTFHYGNLYFMVFKILILFFVDSIHHCLHSLVRRASPWEVLLVQLSRTYDKLADVTHSIQKVYGIPILCMSLSNLTFINCNVFLAITFFNRQVALLFIGWIAIVCFMVFRIFYACERVKEKVNISR